MLGKKEAETKHMCASHSSHKTMPLSKLCLSSAEATGTSFTLHASEKFSAFLLFLWNQANETSA